MRVIAGGQREPFRGHLVECFKDYVSELQKEHPPGSKTAGKAKEPMARFCGVITHTVQRWFLGHLPIGDLQFKLMCFLERQGYVIIELERLPQAQRGLVELIGYGLIGIEEASKLLQYANTSTLSAVLQGKQGCIGHRQDLMWKIWKERHEELERVKHGGTVTKPSASTVPETPTEPKASPSTAEVSTSVPVKQPTKVKVTSEAPPTKFATSCALMDALNAQFQESGFANATGVQLAALPQKSQASMLMLMATLAGACGRMLERQSKGG